MPVSALGAAKPRRDPMGEPWGQDHPWRHSPSPGEPWAGALGATLGPSSEELLWDSREKTPQGAHLFPKKLPKGFLELLSNVSCTSQNYRRRPKEPEDNRGLPTTPIGMPGMLALGVPEFAGQLSGTFREKCKAFSQGFVHDIVIIPRCFCRTFPWICCLKP